MVQPLFYSTLDDVWEVEGSPKESFNKDTGIIECSVRLRTPWSQRIALKQNLEAGNAILPATTPPIGTGKTWPYSVDQTPLNAPGNPLDINQSYEVNAFPPRVVSVDIEPEGCLTVAGGGTDRQFHTYEQAILKVRYTNEYALDAVNETFQPTAEFIKFDHEQYKWLTDDRTLSEGEAPGKLVKGATFTITTQRLDPAVLGIKFTSLVGSCNDNIFSLDSSIWGGITFQKQELLYAQPVTEAVKFAVGSDPVSGAATEEWFMNTTARLVFKPGGWNKYWRPKIETYDQFYKIGDASKKPVINYPVEDWQDVTSTFNTLPWLFGNGNITDIPTPPPPP